MKTKIRIMEMKINMQGRPYVTRSGGDGDAYDNECGASTRYNANGVAGEYGAIRLVLYVK